ncbi:Uncharacterised protein [Mycobacterium tuberculosis]|nr:Uncharacterised protein [Mycobacterium tuberculosis]
MHLYLINIIITILLCLIYLSISISLVHLFNSLIKCLIHLCNGRLFFFCCRIRCLIYILFFSCSIII